MPVYVDDARIPWRGRHWSHLVADTAEELYAAAERLGLRREWVQDRGRTLHYDLPDELRQAAIERGVANAVGWRDVVRRREGLAHGRRRAVGSDSGMDSQAIEANKAVVRRVVEEMWNRGDDGAVEELIAPGMVEHGAFGAGVGGRDDARATVTRFRAAFPDLRLEAQALIAEGDSVVLHWVARGTHQGEFMGVPPTGAAVEARGLDIYRVDDGQVVEHWGYPDIGGLMAQLKAGAVP